MVLNVRASVESADAPDPDHRRDSQCQQGSGDQRHSHGGSDQELRRWVAAASQSVLLGTFGAVALVLAGIGIYGVISYSVAQRTREIGIRAALGATERKPAAAGSRSRRARSPLIGLVIGVAGAIGLTRLMASLLFGVGARDPVTMVTVGVVLASVALMASYVPARRATRVDPIVALRYDTVRRSGSLDGVQRTGPALRIEGADRIVGRVLLFRPGVSRPSPASPDLLDPA